MARLVGVWLGEFAKMGGREAAPAADAGVGRRAQMSEGEGGKSGKGGAVQESTRRRDSSVVLSDSEVTVCMLMDRFAPA
ncbi:uncharacterized protein LOC121053933 [Oryza brachyantha]|uniref:Uncharacterized protein n=1 Tax=Oryza brachyantha TaxID=4533 RepID=J3LT62_ORYBR|nr:uncharacterized protein LOC121053933 [Oryza brachyantha]